jgi:hypothetical protein
VFLCIDTAFSWEDFSSQDLGSTQPLTFSRLPSAASTQGGTSTQNGASSSSGVLSEGQRTVQSSEGVRTLQTSTSIGGMQTPPVSNTPRTSQTLPLTLAGKLCLTAREQLNCE